MIDSTDFPDVEAAVIAALQAAPTGDVATVSNRNDGRVPLVTVGYSGGGFRDWGEAAANVGINVFAESDEACRALVKTVLADLAVLSSDLIEHVVTPVGGVAVTRQTPPFQRYFPVTVYLRGQDDPS